MSATLPLRYTRFWVGAGVVLLVTIMALALLPMAIGIPGLTNDKVVHFLTFTLLMIWFLGVFEPVMAPRVAAALVFYGVLMEFLQSFTPYRSADPYDVLSDGIGISAGWLLASAGLRRWCGRVEALLGASPP